MTRTSKKVKVASPPCPHCGRTSVFDLDRDKLERWQKGELIQLVWPEMTSAKRERMMTGLHQSCWDRFVHAANVDE